MKCNENTKNVLLDHLFNYTKGNTSSLYVLVIEISTSSVGIQKTFQGSKLTE